MSIRFEVENNLYKLIQHKPHNAKFMEHCRKVADHATKVLVHEKITPRKRLCVELAALLHDIDNKEYFSESVNNQNARLILRSTLSINNIDEFIEETITLINLMYSDIEGAQRWMYIPRDCDCLEKVSVDALNDCMTAVSSTGRLLHAPNTERAYTTQEVSFIATPERFNNYLMNLKSNSVIDHCYDHLLHLAKPEILKSGNNYIITEAKKRTDHIVQFIIAYWLSMR